MHLAPRSYVLLVLTAVLAIVAIWSSDPGIAQWWRLPAALWLLGLAYEGLFIRRASLTLGVEMSARAFLGREQRAAFAFHNPMSRALWLEYAPATPENVADVEQDVRQIISREKCTTRDAFRLVPTRLGTQDWPLVPARVRGPLGLAWWS